MRRNFLLLVMTFCLIITAMAVLRFLSAGGIKSFVMEETMDKKPVITASIAVSSFRSNAKNAPSQETSKYYKSIVVSDSDTIKDEILKRGYPPAVREICEAVNLKSTSSVHPFDAV